MKAFNDLTVAEAERLALLSEELGEAIQAIGKIQRHGFGSYDPTVPTPVANRTALEIELGDILCAIELLCVAGDLNEQEIDRFAIAKAKKVWRYLHHQTHVNFLYFKLHPLQKER